MLCPHGYRTGQARTVCRRQQGSAVIEFAFFLPFLILLLLGTVDVFLLLSDQINLSHVSREAAGFLSRGATLEETLAAVVTVDGSLDLDGSNGRVILTEVMRPQGGAPVIIGQTVSGSLSVSSRVGQLMQNQTTAPALVPNGMQLPEGMIMSVVEVFSRRSLFGNAERSGTLPSVTLRSLAAF